MDHEAWIVFALLGLALVLFVTEWLSFDFAALLIVSLLMLSGILTPGQGLSGLSNAATVTIAAMFVVSEGVRRTGGLEPVIDLFAWLSVRHAALAPAAMMIVIALVSAFVNNTAAVALFIPVVITVANRMGRSPSELLIPLSFAAMFGGTCTLIGTSTNILVGSIAADHDLAPFGMFEFLPVGAAFVVVGLVYMMTLGRVLVPPRRPAESASEDFDIRSYVTDVRIGEDYGALGTRLGQSELVDGFDMDVVEVFDCQGRSLGKSPLRKLEAGQVLRVRGAAGAIADLVERRGVEIAADEHGDEAAGAGTQVLVEAVVAPDSGLIGRRIRSAGLYGRYGAVLLAIRRGSELHKRGMGSVRLDGGDSLLLLVDREQIRSLQHDRRFVIASEVDSSSHRRRHRLPVALAVVAGIVVLTAAGVFPIQVCAVAGAVLLVVTGCLTSDEAYEAINWKVVFLLAGVIPLGVAMEETGAAGAIADGVLGLLGDLGPHAVLAGFFGLSFLITAVISNQATAALLAPIAIESAYSLGVEPRPMLMAVTFAASLSFITPVGYQTNTLVYGPGQYRFTDFTRVGLPLNIIFWVIGTLLIPWVWPFTPTL